MPKTTDSITTYNEVLKEIRSGELKQVYFLHGEDMFFPDQLQEEFINLVPEETRDFNLDVLYGRETTLNQALAAAKSFPMMAERRLVIVRDFHHFFEQGRGDGAESNRDDLVSYVENPNPSTILVIIDDRGPDGKTKLGKALNKADNASVCKFEPVRQDQLPQWIEQWARQAMGKEFDPRASQMLAFHVGDDLLALTTEIEKLSTYAKEGTILPEHVKEVVGISREIGIFEFSDMLTAGDSDKILSAGEQMIEHAENPTGEVFKTMGYLTMYFTNLWQMHRLLQKGIPDKDVPKTIGMNPYFYKNLKPALRTFPAGRMPHIFEALLDADRALKGFSTMTQDPKAIFLMSLKRIVSE